MEPNPEVAAHVGRGLTEQSADNPCHAFFSYRREDSQILVQSVWRHLKDALPGWSIFFDLDAVELGASIRQTLFDRIKQATVVFAFVGPKWAGQSDRILASNDWFRTELQWAFDTKKLIVPVLHSGYLMRSGLDAPPGLEWLFDRAGVTIGSSYDSLCMAVEQMRRYVIQKVQGDENRVRDFMESQEAGHSSHLEPVFIPIDSPAPARLQPKLSPRSQ